MRLWSIHPSYLDQKGLCGQWREAVMAKNALEDESHNYHNHPQMARFTTPAQIHIYLKHLYFESQKRGYQFNESLFNEKANITDRWIIQVSREQIKYEFGHLADKLEDRSSAKHHNKLMESVIPKLHPLFVMRTVKSLDVHNTPDIKKISSQ